MKDRVMLSGFTGVMCLLLAGCSVDRKPANAAAPSTTVTLTGTQWILEDLGGNPVIADSRATLTFPEAGKVAGNGSCNRFTGAAKISGSAIKFGPLASTRMMCELDASKQEAEYLKALEDAQGFEVRAGKLYVHVSGMEKPLIFHAAS